MYVSPGVKPLQNDGVPVTPFVNWYSLELAYRSLATFKSLQKCRAKKWSWKLFCHSTSFWVPIKMNLSRALLW